MSPAHLHIVLAHLPIIGIFFGLVLLAVSRSLHMWRAALIIFTVVGLASGGVYLLGEEAEEIVEDMAGISHDLIEEHEEAALWAMISGIVLGLASAVGLFLSRRARPKGSMAVILVLALLTAAIMAVTANRGGQINHPEIRSAASSEAATDRDH